MILPKQKSYTVFLAFYMYQSITTVRVFAIQELYWEEMKMVTFTLLPFVKMSSVWPNSQLMASTTIGLPHHKGTLFVKSCSLCDWTPSA